MRNALVTGANTGIGEVTARELARQGFRVWLACRSKQKALVAINRIQAQIPEAQVEFHPLDLGTLASTRASAEAFHARGITLDLLINNAGLAGTRGLTPDGFEMHFGVNYLGPFLFTRLLEPVLKQTAQTAGSARIVNVASKAHYKLKIFPWESLQRPTRSLTGFAEYAASKLCNVLFSREHARQLAGTGVRTYAVHPGVVASDVWRNVPWPFRSLIKLGMITNEQGAQTSLHCATSPEVQNETGLYYDRCQPKKESALALDDELAALLWKRSKAFCGL